MMFMENRKIKLIAFYLPQFYPIVENDDWWGKGFTEWTNVAQARPLFRGHYQPRIPADLGFYDLRVSEVREAQAELAKDHGIDAFCYWHYWFGGRKKLLERPFREVLESGKPKFPFCLAWANESWTGHWKGEDSKILMKQAFPGEEDYKAHFYEVLPAFRDSRYFMVEGKPLFYIYRPKNLPDPRGFISLWQELARREGLGAVFFVAGGWYDSFVDSKIFDADASGFQATNAILPNVVGRRPMLTLARRRLMNALGFFANRVDYSTAVSGMLDGVSAKIPNLPTILTGWDTTPRSGVKAWVMTDYTPNSFRIHVEAIMRQTLEQSTPYRIIFVKSWNEWAEGNYLEPDVRYGKAFLEVLRNCKSQITDS